MNESSNVVAILPSLNPDDNLKKVVESLVCAGFENIIIVNDGSDEKYDEYFLELEKLSQCYVVTHEVNRGKGQALKTAFDYYLNNFDTTKFAGVVTADADGQHLASDIKKCSDYLSENPDAFVLGVRDFDHESVPPKSKIGNKVTSKIIKLLFKNHISDTQTGLRVIPNRYIAAFAKQKGSRFEYETNMLVFAMKAKIEIAQVTIQTVYFENNRETHFHAVKDSLKIYYIIFKSFILYTGSSLFCFAIDQLLFRLFLIVLSAFGGVAITLATTFARIISAVTNYSINKNVVFEQKGTQNSKFAFKYAMLCVIQGLMSAICTTLLFEMFKFDVSLTKIFVDTILFLISYCIQKAFIFTSKEIKV